MRAAQRWVLERTPGAPHLVDAPGTLEQLPRSDDAPRLIGARVVEHHAMRAWRIVPPPVVGFAAFLDGVQQSRVVAYESDVPIVYGTVAAVVRVRRNRRMVTWRQRVDRRLYLPRAYVTPSLWDEGQDRFALVDTTGPDAGGTPPSRHPAALLERAVHMVQADRERLEQSLAEQWCAAEQSPLLVDGGISGSEQVAVSSCAVGVVKSHRTIYAEGDALGTLLRLRVGERSSVFRITSARRTPVASWYLRLRDPRGHDPMWGLVRVEVAEVPRDDLTARADEVSRWVLAEAAPLALPDARWDKMVYGVRDCEEFLRAIC